MMINDLIKFCDEKSKNIKLKAEPQAFIEIKQALEELKEYKLKEFQCHLAQQEGITIGYNKAIDEFAEKIQWEYLNSCGLKQREIDFLVAVSSMVAEQIKAGGKNEID